MRLSSRCLRTLSTLSCAALLALPVLSLSGCGGNNDNAADLLSPGGSLLLPVFAGQTYNSRVTLANGNVGTCQVTVAANNTCTGTLSVPASSTSLATRQATQINVGFLSGTVDPSTGGFNLSGSITIGGETIALSYVGNFPVPPATTGGSITVTVNGESFTSSFDTPTTPTTPTTPSTPTNPGTSNGLENITPNLTISNIQGSSVDPLPLNATSTYSAISASEPIGSQGLLSTVSSGQVLSVNWLQGQITGPVPYLTTSLMFAGFRGRQVGLSIVSTPGVNPTIAVGATLDATIIVFQYDGTTVPLASIAQKSWSGSAKCTVTELTGNRITLQLADTKMQGGFIGSADEGDGTFTIGGTVTAEYEALSQ